MAYRCENKSSWQCSSIIIMLMQSEVCDELFHLEINIRYLSGSKQHLIQKTFSWCYSLSSISAHRFQSDTASQANLCSQESDMRFCNCFHHQRYAYRSQSGAEEWHEIGAEANFSLDHHLKAALQINDWGEEVKKKNTTGNHTAVKQANWQQLKTQRTSAALGPTGHCIQ